MEEASKTLENLMLIDNRDIYWATGNGINTGTNGNIIGLLMGEPSGLIQDLAQ